MTERRYTYTLEELAQMFVDYDRIASHEWNRKYTKKITALAEHFDMPPGSTIYDLLREAMAVALHLGKPFVIAPDDTTTVED